MKKAIRGLLYIGIAVALAAQSQAQSQIQSQAEVSNQSQAQSRQEFSDYSEEVLSSMMEFYAHGIDEKLYLQLDKPYYSSGDQIRFKGFLRNAITHAELPHSNFIYVELVDAQRKLVSRVKVRRKESGFDGYLDLNPEMEPGNYTLRGYTRWMLNQDDEYFFTRSLKIISPIPASARVAADSTRRQRREAREASTQAGVPKLLDYTVQFFPEGGALLADATQIVAFKALAEDGLSIEVKGEIFDSKDQAVVSIESLHKGMGVAVLHVEPGDSYYAVMTSSEGLERRFALPKVEDQGVTIVARKSAERLYFQIKALPESLLDGAHYIVHSRGRVVAASTVDENLTSALSMSELFDGINVISVVSASGDILSERLMFKRPEELPTADFKSDKDNFGSREKVKVSVELSDSFGGVADGQFGVSVTDESSVRFNEEDENILSYLLLSSDLQGYIESPALYFDGDLAQADRHLDLLLRTQGWRRFDLGQILAGECAPKSYAYEQSAEIEGDVKGFFGNDARQPKIDVICTSLGHYDSFKLDESSRFKLVGVDIPDSATYIIQSRGRRGGNSLTLNIKPDPFPMPQATIAPRDVDTYIPIDFVNQSQDKFFYEGGMNLITLDAVYVTTSEREQSGTGFATYVTNAEELEMMSGLPLTSALQRFPSISISTEGVTHRGNSSYARFLVDDIYMEYEEISYLTTSDVERIEFYSGVDAVMYSDASGGIFVIELKTGASASASTVTSPGIAFVSKLGYQKAAEYYTPSYATPENKRDLPPDFRTTLYWNGALTPDDNGQIEFEFYSADKPTTYRVTLEGIDSNGELYRAVTTINRTASR